MNTMINIKNLFRKNLLVKVLALLASILTWAYVMNEENPPVTSSYTVPIEMLNAPEGYTVDMDIKEVRMKVTAPRATMANLNENDFRAYIDLSGNIEGQYDVAIKTVVPQGVELVGMSDDVVKVTMESLIAHGVPVEISVTGQAAKGMEVAGVKPATDYVNVYGPRHMVEGITKASGRISLTDNTSDFTMRVKLIAVDSDGDTEPNLAVLPAEVDVTVQLQPVNEKKILPVQPSVTGMLPGGYTMGDVTAQPAQVEVSGPSNVLDELKALETAPISLEGATGNLSQTAALQLPEGVTSTTSQVTVNVQVNAEENN